MISRSVTLGSEVSQPECIVISRSSTLCTGACKLACIDCVQRPVSWDVWC